MDENNQIILYQSEDGETRIEVKFTGETVWLSQQQLCDLYQTSKANVSEHIKHILSTGNWTKGQLFGISEQLPPMENPTM